jgi:membrane associated rhomboid family serine protease
VQADREPDGGYVLDAWWRRLPDRPATASLIAVCVLAYTATLVGAVASSSDPFTTLTHSVWTLAGSEPILINLGALELTHIWLDNEWWRLASAGLLHGFLLHLVLNLLALGSLGDWVEHAWGSWRTVLIFALSSISGCLASLVWCESNIVVGASAGALGLAGALWVARRFGPEPFVQQKLEPISSFSLAFLVLLCLGLGAVIPWIAQAGHIGGLAMGLLLGATLVARHHLWRIAGILAATALLVTLAVVGKSPPWPAEVHQFLGLRALADQDTPTATRHFRLALEANPTTPSSSTPSPINWPSVARSSRTPKVSRYEPSPSSPRTPTSSTPSPGCCAARERRTQRNPCSMQPCSWPVSRSMRSRSMSSPAQAARVESTHVSRETSL